MSYLDMMVNIGLESPLKRAAALGTLTAMWCYTAGLPQAAFREDGTLAPWKPLSGDPEATLQHFLVLPVGVAITAYLFT